MTNTASAALQGLGICLEEYEYPYPVGFLPLTNDLQPVKMAYMDIPPSAEPSGKTVVLIHGKAFGCYYFHNVIEALTGAGYRVVAPMLKGYTVPLSPRGVANLATKPPWHYAGAIVAVEFWADPAAAAATLPDGLTPDPGSNGHGTAMFIDWQFNGSREEYLDPLRSQYHEFFVLLDARWQDTPVSWCPYIYVDNDHAMARGWIQGFPKKLGTVAQTRSFAGPNQAAPVLGAGGKFGATAATAGYRLANAQVTLQERVTNTSAMVGRPTVNLRHFPNLTAGEQDKPAVHELVMAIYDNQTVTDAWAGTGELTFPEAPGEELDDLAPVRTGAGSCFTLSYSVTDLRTLQ